MVRSVLPAIVVAAFDRPDELRQLIQLVTVADVASGTPLIISIDGGGEQHDRVRAVATATQWPHGDFRMVEHEHLGLVEHFRTCGDLALEHGAVVLLEDDLRVGPGFHRWATAALDHAEGDARIAGVSLATPHFDGYRHLPFEPVLDGHDNIFAQVPWYDGMAWTADMWQHFRSHTVDPATSIHRRFNELDLADEWFPHAVRYLVETGRYYLLPRHAHATNSGAAGTHFGARTDYFQVPLTLRGPDSWRLAELDHSLAVYDDHLELTPGAVTALVPALRQEGIAVTDLVIDLLGTRDVTALPGSYVLTTRQVTSSIRSWGASLHPLVANLVHGVEGNAIHLAERHAVVVSDASDAQALATLRHHASRGRAPSDRDALRQLSASLRSRVSRDR